MSFKHCRIYVLSSHKVAIFSFVGPRNKSHKEYRFLDPLISVIHGHYTTAMVPERTPNTFAQIKLLHLQELPDAELRSPR